MAGKMQIDNPFLGNPVWAGDFFDPNKWVEKTPMKLDPTQFVDAGAISLAVSAAAVVGATSLPIAALPYPNNTYNNTSQPYSVNSFPAIRSGQSVVWSGVPAVPLTLNAALHVGDTAITVLATSGAIPSGSILTFTGGAEVITSAAVASGVTSIPILASGFAAASTTTGSYAGIAAQRVTLTADANIGDTSLTVSALTLPFIGTETANYSQSGRLAVLSGTLVGRTYSMRASSVNFRPALYNDDQIYIVLRDIPDLYDNNDFEGYRNGATVYENRLPGYTTAIAGLYSGALSANASLLATLRAKYDCKLAAQ